jgi:hypothetical protein
MALLRKFGRLFVIKTRFEAWFVIYAIALGAVERAAAYLAAYPGWLGWTFAAACTGVVFIAGAKLLDSVAPAKAAIALGAYAGQRRAKRTALTRRSRPRLRQTRRVSSSRI